jgi:hypothetical protein
VGSAGLFCRGRAWDDLGVSVVFCAYAELRSEQTTPPGSVCSASIPSRRRCCWLWITMATWQRERLGGLVRNPIGAARACRPARHSKPGDSASLRRGIGARATPRRDSDPRGASPAGLRCLSLATRAHVHRMATAIRG